MTVCMYLYTDDAHTHNNTHKQPTGKHMVYISEQPSGGQPTTDNGIPKKPNDYIGLAVLGLVACCFPFGLIALIKALEVSLHVDYRIVCHCDVHGM